MPCSSAVFSKYLNPVFIETGSLEGRGIQAALDAGFPGVISIELSPKYFAVCKARFAGRADVVLVLGDSEDMLPLILEKVKSPATFWLDGHHSCGDTARGKHWAPLIQELEVIRNHPIKNHTILIDDMRCWEMPNETHGFWKEDIFRVVREINPQYQFSFEDGDAPNDVLVCKPPLR